MLSECRNKHALCGDLKSKNYMHICEGVLQFAAQPSFALYPRRIRSALTMVTCGSCWQQNGVKEKAMRDVRNGWLEKPRNVARFVAASSSCGLRRFAAGNARQS
jgi:hypothetical protein